MAASFDYDFYVSVKAFITREPLIVLVVWFLWPALIEGRDEETHRGVEVLGCKGEGAV